MATESFWMQTLWYGMPNQGILTVSAPITPDVIQVTRPVLIEPKIAFPGESVPKPIATFYVAA